MRALVARCLLRHERQLRCWLSKRHAAIDSGPPVAAWTCSAMAACRRPLPRHRGGFCRLGIPRAGPAEAVSSPHRRTSPQSGQLVIAEGLLRARIWSSDAIQSSRSRTRFCKWANRSSCERSEQPSSRARLQRLDVTRRVLNVECWPTFPSDNIHPHPIASLHSFGNDRAAERPHSATSRQAAWPTRP